jgi:signal transduction histidine kinase/DNA-binding response OmpR family regulator
MIDDKTLPAIALTDFKILNSSIDINETGDSYMSKHITYTDEIHIPHQDNVISFEFAALHFVNPERNQYAYKLEGFDREWIYSGNRRFVTYTNLDPGKYILKIKASNSDGVWNEEGISLTVIVNPPWWQSWWAYILYAVFIVSILYSLRQYEMKRVKLRNELQLKDFEAKKLQEVDQLKSHFFANISHEFRTPLTLILGLLQKFESKTFDKKDLEDYGVMKRNAVRLLQLINQLLELSKIESGKSKLSASESDIIKFTKRIFVSFASYAEQKNIKLRFNNRGINEEINESLNIYFDNDKMEKIISNLISNAVKYTPEGHEIDVKIFSEDDHAQIKVINTGVTISKADLSHLFDRYYKVHRAESGMFEGTGIGLALVKELVELHKGTISVISEYDVTEFVVKIPSGKAHLNSDDILSDNINSAETETFGYFEEEIAEELSLSEFSTELNSGNEIILVVEDHADLRKYIKENLTDTYQVIEAPNGREGYTLAIDMIPDLVISDVMMPEMDGYTFCKKIKSNDKTNHIPVILLTAKASTEDKLEGLELGADDYLIKPFNPDELKLRVRNLIRIREELRQKFTSEMVLKPAEVIVPSSQVQFMERVKSIIEANMEKENFGVDKLADEAGMSRSQLHRKLKAITNQSTTEFIRNFRLQRAAQLILQDAGSMSEIAYKVGFNSQAYFNKSFQELYGCSPTEYKRQQ